MNWEKIKKLNIRIEVPAKVKKLILLVLITWIVTWTTAEILDYFPIKIYRVARLLSPIITALPAIIIFKLDKKSFKALFTKNVPIQIFLGVLVGGLLLGISAVKNGGIFLTNESALFIRFNWYKVYITVYYLLLVGFLEEFTYRVVIQEYFIEAFGRFKVLAPLLAAVVFSIAHCAVGGNNMLLVALVWGIIWGYLKYFNKSFTYLAAGISHGVYDYGLMIVPIIMNWIT